MRWWAAILGCAAVAGVSPARAEPDSPAAGPVDTFARGTTEVALVPTLTRFIYWDDFSGRIQQHDLAAVLNARRWLRGELALGLVVDTTRLVGRVDLTLIRPLGRLRIGAAPTVEIAANRGPGAELGVLTGYVVAPGLTVTATGFAGLRYWCHEGGAGVEAGATGGAGFQRGPLALFANGGIEYREEPHYGSITKITGRGGAAGASYRVYGGFSAVGGARLQRLTDPADGWTSVDVGGWLGVAWSGGPAPVAGGFVADPVWFNPHTADMLEIGCGS